MIARALGIPVERVTEELSYQSIPEWDSLRHVGLAIALEDAFGIRVDDDLLVELHSVEAIRAFVRSLSGEAPAARLGPPTKSAPIVGVHRGLDGVVVDRSSITHIDGERGELLHRGYRMHDLATKAGFEQVAWLLIHGELPTCAELAAFRVELAEARALPSPVVDLIRTLAGAHPVEALRTCVSALGAIESNVGAREETQVEALRAGVRLIAQIPTIVAAHHAIRSGREPLPPDPSLFHAENLLTMLFGVRPTSAQVRFCDMDLVVHADHSSNASAFAARVAIGARSGMHAAITAAISTFAGPLHGGAAERVVDLLDAVGSPEGAAEYVRHAHETNRPVMGFGHRVYRTEDPRVRHLRAAARALAEERGDLVGFDTLEAVVAAMEPYSRHGVAPNVDLYAGLAYRLFGLPYDLGVSMFIAGRVAGWVAQALEQKHDNVLIRPLLQYVGPAERAFPS